MKIFYQKYFSYNLLPIKRHELMQFDYKCIMGYHYINVIRNIEYLSILTIKWYPTVELALNMELKP